MDETIINDIKQIEDRDKVIELLEEAKEAVSDEIKVIFDKLKTVNKELCIAVLEEEILALNCLLAIMTDHIVKKYEPENIDSDQLKFINKLVDSVKIH